MKIHWVEGNKLMSRSVTDLLTSKHSSPPLTLMRVIGERGGAAITDSLLARLLPFNVSVKL